MKCFETRRFKTYNPQDIDMNPTTDHLHVLERAITRSNTKKIQVSNQENNWVADIGKWVEDLSFVVGLPIKTSINALFSSICI